jgi:hypothetical protein
MNMELLIRQGSDKARPWTHKERGMDDLGIRVKITHVWFEGPDDMHVHLKSYDFPLAPLYCEHTGDYIIPDPGSNGFVRCYNIMLLSGNKRVAPLPEADNGYTVRLAETWDFLGGLKGLKPVGFNRRLRLFQDRLKELAGK